MERRPNVEISEKTLANSLRDSPPNRRQDVVGQQLLGLLVHAARIVVCTGDHDRQVHPGNTATLLPPFPLIKNAG